jgi:hypothetical protein
MGPLVEYLYGGPDRHWFEPSKADARQLSGMNNMVAIVSRVLEINELKKAILLERKIHYDLRPKQWRNVEVHKFQPSGFEGQVGAGSSNTSTSRTIMR